MFKHDLKSPQSKSVKSKKQTEINTTLNQNKEYGGKSKFEGGEKKKKSKVKTVVPEADESDQSSCSRVCADLKTFKKKKKKSKSRSSSVLEEKQDSEMEKNPPESEVHEDTGSSLKKKKKRKNKSKLDGHSGPQNIPEGSRGKICVKEPSRVQDESKCNIKRKRKDSVKNADAQEGLAPSNKTSNGTADKSDKMTDGSCVTEAKSAQKKKKRSHSEDIGTHEDKKSAKKRKTESTTAALESGNDPFKLAAARKQRDDQILDAPSNKTDKKCKKKKKKTKAKLPTEERLLDPERGHKGATVSVTNERKGEAQLEAGIECITKSKKKKSKRSADAEGGGIEILDKARMKLDKTSNVCKFQNSPAKATAKGKKQETAFDVLEESVEMKKKMKRKKRETSSGTHVCKVKEELCDSDDLQIMSEKKGNLFETTIDKARRQALQEEIDRVSGKTGASETPASSEIKPSYTGTQWDTAAFQSTEQKNKFLRLMGGFKSLNQPRSTGHSSGKPNMALNKQEEQKFNSTLQKEFDKALNLRQNRGIGLGYQPFPNIQNKTFFIDKSASKSTKFDF